MQLCGLPTVLPAMILTAFGGLCSFVLILELSIKLRIDLPGRMLAMEFEQGTDHYRVEVHSTCSIYT